MSTTCWLRVGELLKNEVPVAGGSLLGLAR
jgi:hypothetical protein